MKIKKAIETYKFLHHLPFIPEDKG